MMNVLWLVLSFPTFGTFLKWSRLPNKTTPVGHFIFCFAALFLHATAFTDDVYFRVDKSQISVYSYRHRQYTSLLRRMIRFHIKLIRLESSLFTPTSVLMDFSLSRLRSMVEVAKICRKEKHDAAINCLMSWFTELFPDTSSSWICLVFNSPSYFATFLNPSRQSMHDNVLRHIITTPRCINKGAYVISIIITHNIRQCNKLINSSV